MCDLIDLNSPDRKGLLNSGLASPLIPAPTDTVCINYNNCIDEQNSQILKTRDSLENNPFDMVLHKTTEYIQKKDDPFEVALEKALRPEYKKNTLRKCSFDSTDDYNLKQNKRSQKSKMNKTLDESLMNEKFSQKDVVNKVPNENITNDLKNTHMLKDNLKSNNVNSLFSTHNFKMPFTDVQDVNLSILNQSVMNDTLYEMDEGLNKPQIKIVLQNEMPTCLEKYKNNVDEMLTSNTHLKVPKLRRSLSQGEKISPKKSQYLNQTSLIESLRTKSGSCINVSSNLPDFLNIGFWKSKSSESSVFSNLSNISSITKLNSVSYINNSSTMLSNDTINRAFLESCSSEKSDNTKLSKTTDLIKKIDTVSNKTQFNKLKITQETSENDKNEVILDFSHNVEKCVTVLAKNKECNTNDKLIDVDIFIPEINCSKEHNNSDSNTSSDSVFHDGNKLNKSILHEAKLLARTFEELALKSSSGSNIDDLITNNQSWISELLPTFDDEVMVHDLIELPISPNTSDLNTKDKKNVECTGTDVATDKHEKLIHNKVEENIKNLEMEFIEPISTEKRITAASLLLDLKKLITTENNVEANNLLENLEKTLGINWENNTELLSTFLSTTNNLAKSPQKSNCSLGIIKNVAENNMEHSQEDNLASNSPENVKESAFSTNMNLNNVNTNKCSINNRKYLTEVDGESENETSKITFSIGKINKKKNENDLDTQNKCKKDSFYKAESNNLGNEKVVLEILANIGKLLTKQTKNHSSLDILKNLGKVLNFTSTNSNIIEDTKADDNYIEIQQTPQKYSSKCENKTHSTVPSKSANRFSLNLDSKKQPVSKNFIRRSISVSQTPPVKSMSSSVMSKGKNTSQLKEVTKRFPSDPGFVSSTSNKKVVTNSDKNNSEKVDIQQEGKATIIGTVKTKLKKKNSTDVVHKKGPMKAILPIGSMQKRESIGKKTIPSTEIVTPPKSHKIISSTPNTVDDKLTVNKSSRSSKPVASSTPDAQNSKSRETQFQINNCTKKRNFSCDISPVTTRINGSNNNGTNNSPRRINKLPSPKRTTPKRSLTESGIPKSRTPVNKKLNASFDVNQYERLSESPQRSVYKVSNSQKNSPVYLKKNNDNTRQSPLRDSNKITHKVKPFNLISKLRQHSIGTNVMEKENI